MVSWTLKIKSNLRLKENCLMSEHIILKFLKALVLATPVYWFSQPAQLKMFVDRMFGLIKFDDAGGIRSPINELTLDSPPLLLSGRTGAKCGMKSEIIAVGRSPQR